MIKTIFKTVAFFIIFSVCSCSGVSVNNQEDQDVADNNAQMHDNDEFKDDTDPDVYQDTINDEDVVQDNDPGCTCDTVEGDEDGDGISNTVEGCLDMDGDNVPNCMDKDSDGDGIADKRECIAQPCSDTDGDGDPDYLDRDSDNDYLSDKHELDEKTNPYISDTDGDGTKDGVESAINTDPLDPESRPPDGIYYVILDYYRRAVEELTIDFKIAGSKLDVVTLIDVSVSMEAPFEKIKEQVSAVINEDLENEGDFYAFGLAEVPYAKMLPVTFDLNDFNASVSDLSTPYSNYEIFVESLYQAVNGSGFNGKIEISFPNGGSMVDQQEFIFPPKDCEGQLGSIGGACMREDAAHLFVLFTDEEIVEIPIEEDAPQGIEDWGPYWIEYPSDGFTMNETLAAMSYNNVKILVVNTGFDCDDDGNNCVINNDGNESHDYLSQMTGTVDAEGNTYNFHTEDEYGNGIRTKLADAVKSLTEYTEKDYTLSFEGDLIDEDKAQYTSDVVQSFKSFKAEPFENVERMDDQSFYGVNSDTVITFKLTLAIKDYFPGDAGNHRMEFQVNLVSDGGIVGKRIVRFLYGIGE